MSGLEKWFINSPLRVRCQELGPTRFFLNRSKIKENPVCLEVGCGRGAGMRIILKEWNAAQVIGFDLDREQIELADRYIQPQDRPKTKLLVGNAAAMAFVDNKFDAVFDYGILHHIPAWKAALAEIYRALKPGGQFFFEEILKPILNKKLISWLLPHPEEGKFNTPEFTQRLHDTGFIDIQTDIWVGGYLLGIAQKPI